MSSFGIASVMRMQPRPKECAMAVRHFLQEVYDTLEMN